jgi:hypothetical protein
MAVGRNRVVAAMAVGAARFALFLDVRDLATGGHFAVSADHAPAPEGREAEKSNETHNASESIAEQYACR